MTTSITAARTAPAAGLTALATYEARRFVRNPVFLAASGLTAYILWDRQRGSVDDINTVTVYPALFLGGLGMIAAFWLTQSMRRSAEALDVSPTTLPARTAAICLVAIVPFVCGALSLLAIVMFQRVPGSWTYGAFSTPDRAAVLLGQTVLPALGGPLLGVALARWLPFPGTALALFLVLYGWATLGYALAATHRNSVLIVMMRFFAPFAFFTDEDSPADVETWRGSPWFFVGWQLCLCAAAVTVALLRGADPRLRARLIRVLITALAVAALMYGLTVTGGWGHPVMAHPGQAPEPIATLWPPSCCAPCRGRRSAGSPPWQPSSVRAASPGPAPASPCCPFPSSCWPRPPRSCWTSQPARWSTSPRPGRAPGRRYAAWLCWYRCALAWASCFRAGFAR